MSSVRVRIAVADDDPGFRKIFNDLLSVAHDVIGVAADGHELVWLVREHCPDLVVLDVTMPGMNGFDVMECCRREGNTAHFVYCSGQSGRAYVQRALRLGARGYVLKSAAMEDLLPAVGTILDGGIFVSPGIKIEA